MMLAELENAPGPFGIGPRMSWDGMAEIPAETLSANPDIYLARLHPCFALIKNTLPFRKAVEAVGFGGKYTRYQVISMALMDNFWHVGEIRLIKTLCGRSQKRQ
jgi:hypothetical protein